MRWVQGKLVIVFFPQAIYSEINNRLLAFIFKRLMEIR